MLDWTRWKQSMSKYTSVTDKLLLTARTAIRYGCLTSPAD